MAGLTGLEPATSCVTGRRSNQLNYNPAGVALRGVGTGRARRALSLVRIAAFAPECQRERLRSHGSMEPLVLCRCARREPNDERGNAEPSTLPMSNEPSREPPARAPRGPTSSLHRRSSARLGIRGFRPLKMRMTLHPSTQPLARKGLAATAFDRPTDMHQTCGQRLERDAVPVRMLKSCRRPPAGGGFGSRRRTESRADISSMTD